MNRLENLFESVIDKLEQQLDAYPFEVKDKYAQWMNQQFYLVQNSTRYLSLSASKVGLNERKEFREWVHHLEEELDHDILVANDLKKMGLKPTAPMDPYIRSIIATQYYDIENYGANALLGYALMLEGLSCRVCTKLADRVESSLGKGMTSYLRFHAKVDEEHYPEGIEKIKTLSVDQQEIVEKNLLTMFALYSSELEYLAASKAKPVINELTI